MIIDCHIHAGKLGEHYPLWWVKELYRPWGGVLAWKGAEVEGESVADTIIRNLDLAGVDKACVMSSDHRRVYGEVQGNYIPSSFIYETCQQYPDRLYGTYGFDALRAPYEATVEMERCVKEWGFRAIKIYPSYDHFDPSDERVFPIYKKAIELDIPVQIHMGWTPCKNAPMRLQQPHLLDEVGLKFPDLKVIVCHLGYPYVEECICLLAKHENFHADLAYWGTFPPVKILQHLWDFSNLCGFDKLLYGSENSHTLMFPRVVKSLNQVAQQHGYPTISEEDLEKILWKNAARLYKIPVPELVAGR